MMYSNSRKEVGMSKNRLAGIIVSCTVIIVAAVVLLVLKPWEGTPSTETYTLATSISPSGAGSISPSGGEYALGVQVTLTANPASGYTFDHWSGSASGITPTITVTMNSDESLTANFRAIAQTYSLTTNVSPGGAGSVSPSHGEYESGVQVTLTASPASGYIFDHWGGDASNTSATIGIIMDSDKNVTAYFEEEPAATSIPITFTGSGETTTPPFNVTTSEWIIYWSYVPDYYFPGSASFAFVIYPRGEDTDYVESVFLPKTTGGSIHSYAGPGEYYIEVFCGNIESWEITIRPP
jgi:hypothetical protein